ncbi:MAG: hypothetical protein Alpg2KO_19790 [Alphaproteobacteria bacterium]
MSYNRPNAPRRKNPMAALLQRVVIIGLLVGGAWYGKDQLDIVNDALNPQSTQTGQSQSTQTSRSTSQQRSSSSDCCLDLTTPQRRQHILTGDRSGGGHKCGLRKPSKSEFPCDWTDAEVIHAISVIARDHGQSCRTQRNGNCVIDRKYRSETIRVVLGRDKRFIITGYPLNRPRNPR